jgi:hypothetical protein
VVLGEADHLFEAIRKEPIVRVYHLTVLALGRDLPERDVVALDHTGRDLVAVNPDPGIPVGILVRDVECPVGAAVVDDGVIQVFVGLSQHALDALAEITLSVVDGSHYADEGALPRCHVVSNLT